LLVARRREKVQSGSGNYVWAEGDANGPDVAAAANDPLWQRLIVAFELRRIAGSYWSGIWPA
jgi:hypothetical protein